MVTFGLRWLIPLAILLDSLIFPAITGTPSANLVSTLAIIFGISAYNLVIWLTLNTALSRRVLRIATIAIDTLISITIVIFVGPTLVWVGLLPVVVAATRFGWIMGVIVAGILVIGSFTGLIVTAGDLPSINTLSPLIIAILLFPLAALGSSISTPKTLTLPRPVGNQTKPLPRQPSQLEQGMIKVVYEMASTLSSSLNYQRVLSMIMDVGVLGLERMVRGSHLSGAVLLFTKDNGKTMLRVAAHRRLTHADAKAIVPGKQGAIGKALSEAEPVVTFDAHDDPELKYFSAFRNAEVVLCIPMRAAFDSYGVLVFANPTRQRFRSDQIEFLQALGNQGTAALQNSMLYQNLSEERDRIIEVDEEARKQLARDLHDGPTQVISGVAMRVSFIRRLLETKPEEAADELYKVEQMARQAAGEIRHMLFTLRPLVLEAQGLVAGLEQLAGKMQETYDQKVTVQADETLQDLLDLRTQGVVFYIVEEAVNNARKHAQAEVVAVRMTAQSDVILVEIKDNGKGFDLAEVEEGYENRGSLGMINLRERAQLIDGTLHIDSAPGKGTHISLLIPLESRANNITAQQQQA